ncbi:MAG: hypothetical protein AAF320_02730, partial [Myxococcota bacterium]
MMDDLLRTYGTPSFDVTGCLLGKNTSPCCRDRKTYQNRCEKDVVGLTFGISTVKRIKETVCTPAFLEQYCKLRSDPPKGDFLDHFESACLFFGDKKTGVDPKTGKAIKVEELVLERKMSVEQECSLARGYFEDRLNKDKVSLDKVCNVSDIEYVDRCEYSTVIISLF